MGSVRGGRQMPRRATAARAAAHVYEGRIAFQANLQQLGADAHVEHLGLDPRRHVDENADLLERLLPLVNLAALMLVRQPLLLDLIHAAAKRERFASPDC